MTTDIKNDILNNIKISDIYSAIRINGEGTLSKNRLVNDSRRTWALVIKAEGITEYVTPSGSYTIDKNHLIILPRGSSYSRSCLEQGECLILEFQALSESDTLFFFEISDISKIISLFSKIERRLIHKPHLYHIKNIQDLYEIFALLLSGSEHEYVPSKKSNMLAPAVLYIQENHCERDIKIKKLAAMCNIGETYFRVTFKQHFGKSPVDYINAKKIERAKELLRSGLVSVSQTASEVGFCNPYYFSRVFKKHAGMSPTEFLKKQRKEEVFISESSNHST